MSDLRIGLVCEGPTDFIIIESILRAILRRPFILIKVHPRAGLTDGSAGQLGGGWKGVYRWCRQYASSELSASLEQYDLVIIHIDADVAGFTYQSAEIDDWPNDDLPCEMPCPPALNSVNALRSVVLGWLNLDAGTLPARWAFCTPSKCTEAWVVAAVYGPTNPDNIMANIECNFDLISWLSAPARGRNILIRRKIERVNGRSTTVYKKQRREYEKCAGQVTARWRDMVLPLSQAAAFEQDLLAATRT